MPIILACFEKEFVITPSYIPTDWAAIQTCIFYDVVYSDSNDKLKPISTLPHPPLGATVGPTF